VSCVTDSTTATAGRILHDAMNAAASTIAASAAAHTHRGREPWSMAATEEPESDRASSADAKSDAEWKRCSGFFYRQRCTIRSSAGGVPGAICEMLVASSFSMHYAHHFRTNLELMVKDHNLSQRRLAAVLITPLG
jgi:hypothetical protein